MNFIYKRLVGIKSLQNIKLIRLFSKKMDSVSKKVDSNIRMFDVAANLSDETFRGVYHGKSNIWFLRIGFEYCCYTWINA